MNKLSKQIALVFVALFATMCVISSCSEEECMIDAEREQKVQKLLRVSRSLANQHEIAMCFTEQMIRGGIDTLTVEDLEQAYEVYAANTVEFYVCTDSVKANENGLKLSRSSRMTRETVLLPGEGSTIIAPYNLYWHADYGLINRYEANLLIRVDWNDQGVSGVVNLNSQRYGSTIEFLNLFNNIVIERDSEGELFFSAEKDFRIYYGSMFCYFMMWVEQHSFSQRMKVTMIDFNADLGGSLYLSNDNIMIPLN
ncbi:MAG: hypothetical protein II200_02695 [Bacteroidaceae bacterium]|nr:hypothetical protein [Bacteroidaceae bacterium]